jgi:hypothetical protein
VRKKAFFFVKKKQKTFVGAVADSRGRGLAGLFLAIFAALRHNAAA